MRLIRPALIGALLIGCALAVPAAADAAAPTAPFNALILNAGGPNNPVSDGNSYIATPATGFSVTLSPTGSGLHFSGSNGNDFFGSLIVPKDGGHL